MIGTHIRALRGGTWSHAIDCGDETVIQLEGDGGAARVRRSYRPEFVSAAEVVEVVAHRDARFSPEEVVARAYSLMGDPAAATKFRDSASFAAWCATGQLEAAPAGSAAPAGPTGTTGTRRAPGKTARRKGAPRRPTRTGGR
jgi:hypothetical protein